MSIWRTALETALVGVARKSWDPPAAEGELGAVLQGVQTDGAALSLLRSIAVLSVYRQAGAMPTVDSAPTGPPSPEETAPACGPRVAFHLHQMLSGQFPDLLSWTLEQLAEAQQRVPAELLPALLDYSKTRPIQDRLRQVCGERGRWLAALNPAWHWLPAADTVERSFWETGSAPQRLAVLRQVRRADPSEARALLELTWAQDKAELRTQFLDILRENLSAQDEAFLESRLEDRSWAVRQSAAELLSLLPGSAYVRRMETRLTALVRIERTGLLRTRTVQLTLPDMDDHALLRDGIKGGSTRPGLGEQASALAQMIAAVPPDFWTARFNLQPTQLLKATAAGEWKDLLWQGWQEATKRHGDADWAQALAETLPFESLDAEILMLLPPAERDRHAFHLVREQPLSALWRQIPRLPAPWSLPFTQALIHKCLTPDNSTPALAHALRTALVKMPPEAVGLITPQWPSFLSELAAGLTFLHALHSDLQNRL